MQRCFFLVAIVLCVWCVSVQGQSAARSEWMRGYVKMESADKAMRKGQGSNAMGLYREAQEIFERVRRKYPSWNSSLLNYRIGYCKEQIEKLGRTVGKTSTGLGRSDLLTLTKEQYTTIGKLNDERKTLQSRVEVLTEALNKARSEAARNAGVETSLAQTTRQNGELKERLELLELKLSASQREVGRLKEKAGLAEELKRVEADLKVANSQLEQSQQSLTSSRLAREVLEREKRQMGLRLEGLERELRDLEMALKVVRELSAARKQENAVLQAKTVTLEKRLSDTERGFAARGEELKRSSARMEQMASEVESLRNLRTQEAEKVRRAHEAELKELRKAFDELSASGGKGSGAPSRREVMERLSSQLEAKDAELSKLAKGMASLFGDRERMMALEEELAGVRRQLSEMRGDRDRHRAQALSSGETAMTLRGEVERLKGQLSAAERQCMTLRQEAEKVRREHQARRAEKIEEKGIALAQKLSAAEQAGRESERQLKVQIELVRGLETEVKRLREQVTSQAGAMERLTSEREASGRLLAKARAESSSVQAALAGMTEREGVAVSQVRVLEKELKQVRSELASVQAALSERSKALSERSQALAERSQALLRLEKEHQALRKRESELLGASLSRTQADTAKIAGLVDELNRRSDDRDRQDRSMQELQGRLEVSESNRQKAEKGEKALRETVQGLESELGRVRAQLEQLRGELSSARGENQGLRGTLATTRKQVERLEVTCSGMRDKVNVVDGMTLALNDAKTKLAREKLDNQTLRQRVTVFEGQLRESDVKVRSLGKQLNDIKSGNQEALNRVIESLRGKLAQAENRVKALESVLSEGGEARPKGVDETQAVRENSALKKLNEALTRQNSLLREQNAMQSERLAELAKCRSDLEKAAHGRATLQQTVGELTRRLAEARSARAQAESRVLAAEVKSKSLTASLAMLKADRLMEAKRRSELERVAQGQEQVKHAVKETTKQLSEARAACAQAESRALAAEGKAKSLEAMLKTTEAERLREVKRRSELERVANERERAQKVVRQTTAQLSEARSARAQAESRALSAEVKAKSLEAMLETTQAELSLLKATRNKGAVLVGDSRPEIRAERSRRENERSALVEGYVHQGLDAERQGKTEAARWNYEKALSLESDNKTALQRLGQLAYQAGDDDQAITYLRQAFYHDPDDSQTLFALGYSYARQSKADWAVSMMGRAVSLNPDDATMARVYGATLVQLGWTDAAEREFRRALKLNPKEKDAAFNLSVLLLSKASQRTGGLTAVKYQKLRQVAQKLGQELGTGGRKVTQACLGWLQVLAKPGLSLQAEAKRWYLEAKKLGVEPDPALEAMFK